jgi:hypothetical protein
MRAVVWCAIVSVAVVLVGGGRATAGQEWPRLGREPTCEEQCRLDADRDEAACDARALQEGDRALCREAVHARRDVCLRVCED